MVGDLVVAREGGVDRGAPLHHVGEDAVDDQVADDDAERRPQERVDAAAVAARPDVAPLRPPGGRPLEHDLPEEEHEHRDDVEAVGEERPVAGIRALLGVHAADGQDHVVGLAREQVAAARAAVGEQALPGGVPALDLRAVRRPRAGDELRGLLLDPAEGRDVVVRAEQDPGLARAGLRGEIGLPLGEAVRALLEPARHRRRVAVAHRALQHGQREPVDLEEDDPGRVGHRALAGAPGDPLRHAQRVGVVVVRAEHDVEHDASPRRRRRRRRAPTRTSRSARSWSVMRSAASSISASATRISTRPVSSLQRQAQRRQQRRHDRVQDGDRERRRPARRGSR